MKQRHIIAKMALASACAAVGLMGFGCEKPQAQADKQVKEILQKSAEFAESKDRKPQEFAGKNYDDIRKLILDDENKAYTKLQEAVGVTQASTAAQITAKTRLAEASYAKASGMISGIQRKELKAIALAGEIDRLCANIASNNAQITLFKAANPENVSAAGKSVELTKGFQAVKDKHAAEAADLAKAAQTLSTSIDALTAEIKGMEQRRDDAMKLATDKMTASEQAQGRDSVKLYSESLATRREGLDLDQKLGLKRVDLARLQLELKQTQDKQKLAEQATTRVQGHLASSEETWTKTKEAIAALETASKDIYEGKDKEPGIKGRAAEIGKLLAEAAKDRADADKLFEVAGKNYEEAGKFALKLHNELRDLAREQNYQESPARKAIGELQKLYETPIFSLLNGRVAHARGMLRLNEKLALAAQNRVVKNLAGSLVAAGLAMPEAFATPTLQQSLDSADKDAKQYLTSADTLFEQVGDTNPIRKTEAAIHRIGVQYSLFQLSGDRTYLEKAREQLKSVQGDRPTFALPSFPEELETGIITRSTISGAPASSTPSTTPETPTTVPSTQPDDGTTPTTAPADGATPATPPADGGAAPATPATPAVPAPADGGAVPATPAPADGGAAPATPATPATPAPADGGAAPATPAPAPAPNE